MFPAVESAGPSVILSRFPGVGPVRIDSRDGYFRFSLDPEWAGGGFPLPAFFATIRGADGLSGEFTVRSAKIVLRAVNGPSDGFLPVEPDSGVRIMLLPGGRSMLRAVLATDAVLLQGVPQRLPDRMPVRGMGARAFSPAGLCAMIPPGGYGDAGQGLYIKKRRRHSRFGMSPPCGPFGPLSVSVCSQSAVSRRLLLRQKEEKALQLTFCSAAASTSSGRFAKKSKPVSRSITSTETT